MGSILGPHWAGGDERGPIWYASCTCSNKAVPEARDISGCAAVSAEPRGKSCIHADGETRIVRRSVVDWLGGNIWPMPEGGRAQAAAGRGCGYMRSVEVEDCHSSRLAEASRDTKINIVVHLLGAGMRWAERDIRLPTSMRSFLSAAHRGTSGGAERQEQWCDCWQQYTEYQWQTSEERLDGAVSARDGRCMRHVEGHSGANGADIPGKSQGFKLRWHKIFNVYGSHEASRVGCCRPPPPKDSTGAAGSAFVVPGAASEGFHFMRTTSPRGCRE